MKIVARDIPPRTAWALEQAGVHPLLARLYAARGVQSKDELDDGLARLLPPASMKGIDAAARLLADAMAQNLRLVIVADYDCDGATACAVGVRGLRLLGAQNVDYLVPDRVADGYGLSPSIARRVKERGADVLITVDNGIASVEGVAEAKALGLQVLVTDHHLPGPALPAADAIVNPNQPGCTFESKSMAGVGVMFYVLLALRAELRARGVFDAATQPKLDPLLTLVALGTVADVVKLDANNRRLVAQGLKRIRAGQMPAGVAALFTAAGRQTAMPANLAVAALTSQDQLLAWAAGRTGDFPAFLAAASDLGLDRIGRADDAFLSHGAYGLFPGGTWQGGVTTPFDPLAITEDTGRAWLADAPPRHPACPIHGYDAQPASPARSDSGQRRSLPRPVARPWSECRAPARPTGRTAASVT